MPCVLEVINTLFFENSFFMQYDTIVTAPGSLGDVNPLLGIARCLQARGRKVLFLAAEPYLHLAERAQLQTRVLTNRAEFETLVRDPGVWHPRRGPKLLLDKMLGDAINPHYEWLLQSCVPGETLMVSHMLDFGGRVFRDRFPQTKLATVVLAPVMFRSLTAPPRVSRLGLEHKMSRGMLRAAYWLADRFIDSLALKHINPLRKRVGLAPVQRLLKEWWMSQDLVLAMFPDWYSVPRSDLPAQVQTVGFPMTDSASLVSSEVDEQLQKTLAKLNGARPIVFAPGSAHFQARDFLISAVAACRQLELPAILLSADPEQVPHDLPANIVSAQYLPFSKLLPLARAVVHHGGVGTTSQCFAAGVPQIVLPMAFDQFDNADRVAKLGCGSWMPMTRLTPRTLQMHLRNVEQASPNLATIAERCSQSTNACEAAADACMKILNA